MRIPFNKKYRKEIESGKYKVVTESGKEVRIICWDRKTSNDETIIALCPDYNSDNELTLYLDKDGNVPRPQAGAPSKVMIETEDKEVEDMLFTIFNTECSCDSETSELLARHYSERVRECARKELEPKIWGDIKQKMSQVLISNMHEDKLEGIQRDLVEYASNVVSAFSWLDVLKSTEAYAERIGNTRSKNLPSWYRVQKDDFIDTDGKAYFLMNDDGQLIIYYGNVCPCDGWLISHNDLYRLPRIEGDEKG